VVLQYFGRFADELEGTVSLHQVQPMSRLSLLHPAKLVEVFRAIRPDVVHSHTGVWLKASRAARLAAVPVVVHTEHGRPDPVPLADRLIDNQASRRTDTIVAVSEALAQLLQRQVIHDPARLRVIVNGVDTDRLRPATNRPALKLDLGIPEQAQVIGSVGRLEPIKNYQLALHAFARLEHDPNDAQSPWLVLVGDGRERAALEQLARALGIAGRVKFLGWREDVSRLYGAFDVFTLVSKSEGTSVSLLEAMSSAICPIVTDVGGNRAVLGPELESLLVPAGDAQALAAAWSEQLKSHTIRDNWGQLARLRVEQTFSVTRMVEDYAALYRAQRVNGARVR
jgi:glycosyltransferase involved in cell wall biosynthesis